MLAEHKMDGKVIETLFTECDKDGSGAISMVEFGMVLKKHPELMAEREIDVIGLAERSIAERSIAKWSMQ
eukprot:CAMPEP_0174737504 /NCGR_PEP_ID=MMETSP1094-20130205/68403_1 /TAXON_ID=156173 /ORGANISM="Chrysochromulina brevifilum, Strain UTEX LB 985" /LENGTH=69 /DNA_ID=CAMNT_0015940739 /DNA_START=12 /DNA_END=221 /DNA_ORIENTATION=-